MNLDYYALKLLDLAIHVAGLAICFFAYRRCGKRGFLVIGAYYLLAVLSLTCGPIVSRAIHDHQSSQGQDVLSPEALTRYSEDLAALDAKYFPMGRVIKMQVSFPVGPIVLLCGIWILTRRESKAGSKPDAATNISNDKNVPQQDTSNL